MVSGDLGLGWATGSHTTQTCGTGTLVAVMTSVFRVTAVWNGFVGAPGYTKFAFQDLTDATSRNAAGAKVRQLFEDTKAYRQSTWSVAVQAAIDELDMATGALLGTAAMTVVPAASVGSAAAIGFAGGSGFCVTWNTGLIFARRRVRGRTFFVPATACFDPDGTLVATALTAINAAAATFITPTAPRPNIWQRQWSTAHPPVQIGGGLAPIETYTLRDSASQLRSRRL